MGVAFCSRMELPFSVSELRLHLTDLFFKRRCDAVFRPRPVRINRALLEVKSCC